MNKNKIIRFLHSLIILPIVTTSISGNTFNLPQIKPDLGIPKEIVFLQKDNKGADEAESSNKDEVEAAQLLKVKGQAIDNYFKSRGMPLFGMGEKMALEAEKNGLDWRLVAAISVRESTGGKFSCVKASHNAFGWGSCKISFKSQNEAIETVARNLGGNNPKTAKRYADKSTKQILQVYNPPSIVLRYADQVISIMDTIGEPNPAPKKELAQASA